MKIKIDTGQENHTYLAHIGYKFKPSYSQHFFLEKTFHEKSSINMLNALAQILDVEGNIVTCRLIPELYDRHYINISNSLILSEVKKKQFNE